MLRNQESMSTSFSFLEELEGREGREEGEMQGEKEGRRKGDRNGKS